MCAPKPELQSEWHSMVSWKLKEENISGKRVVLCQMLHRGQIRQGIENISFNKAEVINDIEIAD
jgi:hypothetical protein